MTTTEITCSVCGDLLEAHTEAYCNNCGEPYHLNQRADLPGKDCGEVWINEEHLGLEYACNRCLHPEPPPEALDDIIDSGEAAALAGVDEVRLISAADTGALRHRKTAGGTYLFQRGDVIAFSQAGQ